MTNAPDEEVRPLVEAARRARSGAVDRLGRLWWWFLVRGLLAVLLGVVVMFWPSLSVGTLVTLVGVYCFADGVSGLIVALRSGDPGQRWPTALVSLAIGAILIFWPGATLRLLLTLFGVLLVYVGCNQWLTARRLPAEEATRSLLSGIGVAAVIGGLLLVFWPSSGVAAIAWVIGIAAFILGVVFILLGLRFRRLGHRIGDGPPL